MKRFDQGGDDFDRHFDKVFNQVKSVQRFAMVSSVVVFGFVLAGGVFFGWVIYKALLGG